MCLMNDALLTDENLQPGDVSKMEQIRLAGLPDSAFVMGACLAVKRPFLELALPLPDSLAAHDNWLVGLAEQLGLVVRTPKVLQFYRRHDANVSDFYVNSVGRLTRRKRILEYLKRLPKRMKSGSSLEREYAHSLLLLNRIQSGKDFCSIHLDVNELDKVQRSLGSYVEILGARQVIRAKPVLHRLGPVMKLWHQGHYGHSGGMPGALKDLTFKTSAM